MKDAIAAILITFALLVAHTMAASDLREGLENNPSLSKAGERQ